MLLAATEDELDRSTSHQSHCASWHRGIFDSPRSFLTCLYSEMLTYAGLRLNCEGTGKSLLSQLSCEFQNRWALVRSLHSPQSWTFPQGASPFPPLSSWGLQFLNSTGRARGLWGQAVKDGGSLKVKVKGKAKVLFSSLSLEVLGI